jgi:membrane protease YdiL (CAAX protease family)
MLDFLSVIFLFAPLLLILFFANQAQRMRERDEQAAAPAAVSYIVLILMYCTTLALGLVFLAVNNLPASALEEVAGEQLTISSPLWLSLGLVLPSILGLLLLLKPMRRLAARFTQLDPDNPVHTVALSLTMVPLIALGFTLGIGLDTLASQLEVQSEQTGSDPFSLAALWAQAVMFLLMALIGVGWLSRRSWREALARLGLVRPTGSQVLLGIGAALLMVPAAMALEALFNAFGLTVGQDVESLSEMLMGPLFATPWGIISVGLAAAIGEEPVFRGALQPRFGLLLSSLIFAVVHSQYGISLATIIVLALGLVLGIIRQRTNTTTSIITHAVYNSTLGALAYFAAQALTQQP